MYIGKHNIATITFSFVLVLFILFRYLFFELYLIPSGSMENTLWVLDRVLSIRVKSGIDTKKMKWGLPINIKRGDIVIFSLNENQSSFYIKRCIGMPGDIFEIKNEITFCNNIEIELPEQSILRYKIWVNNNNEFYNSLNSTTVETNHQVRNLNNACRELALTMSQYSAIKNADFIDSISHSYSVTDSLIQTFPQSPKIDWTIHDFGPLNIPYKGMKINLTEQNITLYDKVILQYENENIFVVLVNDSSFSSICIRFGA